MSTIIDLDDILGEDKLVKLQGETYRLPPDLPVELYLKIQRLASQDASETEMIEALYEDVLTLFRHKKPDLKELPLSLAQLVTAIPTIYGGGADEDDAARPQRTRGGASSRSRGTRSRSST